MITVRELVPALVDDYISFFDGVYHDDPWLNTKDNPWWGICYCGFYDDPGTEQERNKIPNAQMENRKQRGEYIQYGKAHGLLAYLDGRVVGVATVSDAKIVTVDNSLVLHTTAPLPFRTDYNPRFRLHVLVNGTCRLRRNRSAIRDSSYQRKRHCRPAQH